MAGPDWKIATECSEHFGTLLGYCPLPNSKTFGSHSSGVSGFLGLPKWRSGKEPSCQCRICGLDPWSRKISWRRKWQSTPVFLPGKSNGQRSLAGYSPWGHKELDTTEHTRAYTHTHMHTHTHTHIYIRFPWSQESQSRGETE